MEYGRRRHSSTGRLPLEQFLAEELPALSPAPSEPYDVPLWCDPKVHRDQHARVARALSVLPDVRVVPVQARIREHEAVGEMPADGDRLPGPRRPAPGKGASTPAGGQPKIGARASRTRAAWPDVIMLPRIPMKRGLSTPETMYCQR